MLTRRHLLAGAAALAAGVPGAGAQSNYANQPIHILVGYAAGGGVDIVARLLQEPMKAALGQPIVIENRTGASAMLATGAVAKAPPDGYMLLMAASGEVAINHLLFKEKMAYDPVKELVPIAMIGSVPCVVVVADATPVRNPKELIAYAKANPGKLSFSSSGIGNPQQLAGELMNSMAGNPGAARALSRLCPGSHRRRNRRRYHELLESRRGAAPDAGRQDPRDRGHLARSHAAIA
jgi:tripartite-type tricarboxylate transporter receptor subunit TctC